MTTSTSPSDMIVRLYDLPPLPSISGITIRRARPFEKHVVLDWIRSEFGEGWVSETDTAFGGHPISCFVAAEGSQLMGFACYDATAKGFFGPEGVSADRRGRGVGRALLIRTLQAMWEYGYPYAIIGAAGPQAFYTRTVGAIPIPDSFPGFYRDPLTRSVRKD